MTINFFNMDDAVTPITVNTQNWPFTAGNNDLKAFDPSVSWPKISIVTPSFNQGTFIEETIRSVLAQNYPNLEYIIIDGGSTDETLSIIRKYEPWITYWVSEPDKGQSHAINKGLEKCTGDIFNWLNSDDWYLPDTFFSIAAAFIKHPSVQLVSGYENHIELDGSVTVDKGTFLANTLEETIDLCQLTQPSSFFSMQAIKQIGAVPEDIHYIMDGEIWIRLLLLYGHEGFHKIEKPLVNFRLHQNSKTVSNAMVDNFLAERSSIIFDLQTFTGVPPKITDYWIRNVYKTQKYYHLNRQWKINDNIITSKQLQRYFVRKYINLQFQKNNLGDAYRGLKQLVKSVAFDFFVVKGFLKLAVRGVWKS